MAGGAASATAAAAASVRTREQVGDLVGGGKPLEYVGPEGRRRGDGEAHYLSTVCGRRIAIASLRLLVVRPVDDQDAVEVVDLVLHGPGTQAFELEADLPPGRVDALRA